MPDYAKPEERLALLSEVIDDTSGAMIDDLEAEIRILNHAISGMLDMLKPSQVDMMLERMLELAIEDPDELMTGAELDVKAQMISTIETALEIGGAETVTVQVTISPAVSIDEISDEDFEAIGVHDVSVIKCGRSLSDKVLDVVNTQIPMSLPEQFCVEIHQDDVKVYPE
jgi:metal-sulfur cluster biosynthetic enzyme